VAFRDRLKNPTDIFVSSQAIMLDIVDQLDEINAYEAVSNLKQDSPGTEHPFY